MTESWTMVLFFRPDATFIGDLATVNPVVIAGFSTQQLAEEAVRAEIARSKSDKDKPANATSGIRCCDWRVYKVS